MLADMILTITMLMGTAEILASIKGELKGTVKFTNQRRNLLKAKEENNYGRRRCFK
jgi:hypothetical protein